MRRTPDGKREVVEMQVPLRGSRSRTVRMTGAGLPPKIGVGAVDLPDEKWIEIMNRSRRDGLVYTTVETVLSGMVPLPEKHLVGDDEIHSARAGASFGNGGLEAPHADPGEVAVMASPPDGMVTMAWMVTDARGKCLLVFPGEYDSFTIAEAIAEMMHGEYAVEVVTSGVMTAEDGIAAPGWRVCMEPPRHIVGGETPSFH